METRLLRIDKTERGIGEWGGGERDRRAKGVRGGRTTTVVDEAM